MSDAAIPTSSEAPRTESKLLKQLIFVRYAGLQEMQKRFQTSLLGAAWLVLGPALLMCLYWFVFEKIVGIEFRHPATGEGAPFLAAFGVGFLHYLALGEFINSSSSWFKSKRRLILESDLPLWAVYGILVVRIGLQFIGYAIIAIGICLAYGLLTPLTLLAYLPVAFLIFVAFAGVGLVFAFLGVFFGDVKEMTTVIMRILLYTSSITFPLTLIPESFRWAPMLNPLTWAVELTRDFLLWQFHDPARFLLGVLLIAAAAWAIGLFFYWRLARIVEQVV